MIRILKDDFQVLFDKHPLLDDRVWMVVTVGGPDAYSNPVNLIDIVTPNSFGDRQTRIKTTINEDIIQHLVISGV